MSRKVKIAIIVIFLLVIGIVFVKSFNDLRNYQIIHKGINLSRIFIDSVCKNVNLDYSQTNKNDTLCCYNLQNQYEIVVWKTEKYNDIKSTNTVFRNISKNYFTSYLNVEINELTIQQINNKLVDSSPFIIFNKGVECNKKCFYQYVRKFCIGCSVENLDLHFDFLNNQKTIYFSIKHDHKQDIFLLIYPINNNTLNEKEICQLIL